MTMAYSKPKAEDKVIRARKRFSSHQLCSPFSLRKLVSLSLTSKTLSSHEMYKNVLNVVAIKNYWEQPALLYFS